MGIKTGKKRIYAEREKIRQTTHWDMDYLPKEVVARRYLKPSTDSGKTAPRKENGRQQRRLGLVFIGVGTALFVCAIWLARFMRP
jgi:hypothetical protein